jgi:hypothetical protein
MVCYDQSWFAGPRPGINLVSLASKERMGLALDGNRIYYLFYGALLLKLVDSNFASVPVGSKHQAGGESEKTPPAPSFRFTLC